MLDFIVHFTYLTDLGDIRDNFRGNLDTKFSNTESHSETVITFIFSFYSSDNVKRKFYMESYIYIFFNIFSIFNKERP